MFPRLAIAFAFLPLCVELPVFGKDFPFFKLVLPFGPKTKNHVPLAAINEGPTPIPIIARGSARFDELLPAHMILCTILENSVSDSTESRCRQSLLEGAVNEIVKLSAGFAQGDQRAGFSAFRQVLSDP